MAWVTKPKAAAAKAPKKATLHKRRKMKMPAASLVDPWKHIGMAKGQK